MVTIPSISELYANNLADLEAEFSISIPLIGKNFLRALAAVQAGKQKIQYLAIAFVQKNIFADTADSESIGGTLERFGRVKLGRNPFPATAGVYGCTVIGSPGTLIPALTTFKSNDDALNPSQLYILDADYLLVAGPNTISLRALTAGLDGQLLVGNQLTITAPIALLDNLATVTAETTEPLVAESLETYRRLVLQAYRLEPQGGAHADYRLWASEIQGVQQAYPYTGDSYPRIRLFIEATEGDSTDGHGTPPAAMLTEVQENIELPTTERPSRKPINDVVEYLPIAVQAININIADFPGATAAIQVAIENTITAEIDRTRPFIGAIDVLSDRNDLLDGNKIISLILEAAPGSTFGAVTFTVAGIPQLTYTFDNGETPYLNSITYV